MPITRRAIADLPSQNGIFIICRHSAWSTGITSAGDPRPATRPGRPTVRAVRSTPARDTRCVHTYDWRGEFTSAEVNALHSEAFDTRIYTDAEWNWRSLVDRHSLGWVVARDDERMLIGFVNVLWDGLVHAWVQDTMVAVAARRHGVGKALVAVAEEGARSAGCEWLHVDFDDDALRDFYFRGCGFSPTHAGLKQLQ